MCGILAVLGCIDNSQAKRSRIIELSRRYHRYTLVLLYHCPLRLIKGSKIYVLDFGYFLFVLCRLRHRGPDWSGLHCHQDCYLAHERLAIIDPTSGDQPLYNQDKTVVVTVLFLSLAFLSNNYHLNDK